MKQKQKETKTERETATLSAESAQRSQRTAWSMEQVGQPTSSQSQSQVATKRTDCPTVPPTVRLSVCPSIWATPKRAKANRALPKLTRSKMSDGLIGLNAGKIYLSTLVGFGFCLRSYTWAAGQQLLPLHTRPSPHLPSLLMCPTPFWLLIYLALSKTELIVASL